MRRAFFVVLVAGTAVGAACSFPDVVFAPAVDGGLDGSHVDVDARVDGSTTDGKQDGGPSDAGEKVDYDANIPIDDGGKVIVADASACDGGCDCDGDGYFRTDDKGCDGGPTPDCDDLDGRTHPGAGGRYDPAVPPRYGDWNCDGTVTKLIPEKFACADHSPLLSSGTIMTSCTTFAGFSDQSVPCGGTGTYQKCKDPTLLGACQNAATSSVQQACQ